MLLKNIVLAATCIVMFASSANAQEDSRDISELSTPIVMLTPAIAQNAEQLGLNTQQQEALQEWMANSPAKREALEDRVVAQRKALRQMIIEGADPVDRAEKAAFIGQMESELLMMRSNCTDHWREVLSDEQFAQVIEIAGF